METSSIVVEVLIAFTVYILSLPFCFIKANRGNAEKEVSKELKNKLETEAVDCHSLISVVIPCYNEESSIANALESAFKYDYNVEVIVSDGGSTDETLNVVRKSSNCKIVTGGLNRSECLRLGANIARGDILLFLHADSVLPTNYGLYARSALLNATTIMGCFEFQPESTTQSTTTLPWRIIAAGTNFRSRYFQFPYGDQALFLRRDVYNALGGFPVAPFMEDFDFVARARRLGRIVTVPAKVMTSARRWEMNGVIMNTCINQIIILGRFIGVPHHRLAQWYYGLSRKKKY